ncbi:unnamed protein product [Cochlearia groenlandica]
MKLESSLFKLTILILTKSLTTFTNVTTIVVAKPDEAENEVIEMVGDSENNTRRSLRGKGRGKWSKLKGPCTASNLIDKCWHCRTSWANRRKKLAKCARGFGHRTTGSKLGRIYVVTSDMRLDLDHKYKWRAACNTKLF